MASLIIGGTNSATTLVIGGVNSAATPTPVPIATPPNAPFLSIQAGSSRLDIAWVTQGDGGSPITGYTLNVVSSNQSEAPLAFSFGPTTNAFSVNGLTNGRTYTVTLTAQNVLGSGAASTAIGVPAAAGTQPGQVTGLALAPLDRAALATFTAPSNAGPAGVTGYRITLSSAGVATRTYLVTSTTATLMALTNGVTYQCSVVATGTSGNSTPVIGFVTPLAFAENEVRPDSPANLVLQPYKNAAYASWTAPSYFGTRGFSDYLLEIVSTEGSWFYSTTSTNIWIGQLAGLDGFTINVYTRTGVGQSLPLVGATENLSTRATTPANQDTRVPSLNAPISPQPGTNPTLPDGYVDSLTPVPPVVPFVPPMVYTTAPTSFIYAFPQFSLFNPANFGLNQPAVTAPEPGDGGGL